MTKKKVLFMLVSMNIGGTEKALLNMIAEMPEDNFDITLLLMDKSGGFLDLVPKRVKVLELTEYQIIKELIELPLHHNVLQSFKKGKVVKALKLAFIYVKTKFRKEYSPVYEYVMRKVKPLEEYYDTSIAYAGPMDFISYFVLHRTNAKQKIQWIHFDVSKMGFNHHFASRYYPTFNKINVVSEEGKNKLVEKLPKLENKTNVFHNIISKKQVQFLANQEADFQDNFNGIRIVTVGRLTHEKGQELALRTTRRLVKEKIPVKWYCIGEGSQRANLEKLIRMYQLNENFLLLGAKANPYPYMKSCNIYVQPSMHEGYCITLAEARCFDMPIITTDFTGAREQMAEDKGYRKIVKYDEAQLFDAIREVIENLNEV